VADPGKGIQGWMQPSFRFGGLGTAPTVAHSDIFSASLPGALAGPGVATTAARSDIVPIGVPWPWLTGTPPNGYVLMDGSNVSRTTYAPLFALWGTTYGVGDGSTTFGLPDFRGRAIIGAGTGAGLMARTLNATGGEETHVLTTAELASHNHGNTSDESAQHTHTPAVGTYGQVNNFANESTGLGGGAVGPGGRGTPAGSVDSNGHVHGTSAAGSGTAHNTMPPFFVVNWIVRAA
jgi:microcystin-dependent protein